MSKKIVITDTLLTTIKNLQHKLVLSTPQLSQLTLSKLIYHRGLSEDRLYVPIKGGFQVRAPNYFVQKIRAIYYLLLVCVFGEKSNRLADRELHQGNDNVFNSQILIQQYSHQQQTLTTLKNAFTLLKLNIYTDAHTPKVHKKYLSEFTHLLSFLPQSPNRIANTINKYPIIDEILINALIRIVGNQTLDDNLNIQSSLREVLGLSCQFVMYREFRVEGVLVRVMEGGFRVGGEEGVLEMLVKEEEKNVWEMLDVSRVSQFQDDIFNKMKRSYIQQLTQQFQQLNLQSSHDTNTNTITTPTTTTITTPTTITNNNSIPLKPLSPKIKPTRIFRIVSRNPPSQPQQQKNTSTLTSQLPEIDFLKIQSCNLQATNNTGVDKNYHKIIDRNRPREYKVLTTRETCVTTRETRETCEIQQKGEIQQKHETRETCKTSPESINPTHQTYKYSATSIKKMTYYPENPEQPIKRKYSYIDSNNIIEINNKYNNKFKVRYQSQIPRIQGISNNDKHRSQRF